MANNGYLGTIEGRFACDADGGAAYTIPLTVPPGTGGMAPSLALVYNSGVGNGLLGMGWGLRGLSSITRCPQTPAQDGAWGAVSYDTGDRFALDGRRLMLVSGSSYGAANAVYHTEIESWQLVVPVYDGTPGRSGPDSFVVSTKDGRTVELGGTPDSQVQASADNPSIRVWLVNKVTDLNGNYLTITYQPDPNGGNTNYPLSIDYTGNGSLAPQRSVQFTYGPRGDCFQAYLGGYPFATTQILTQIQTFLDGNLIRTYSLAYQQGQATGRSQLAAITEADADGMSLPPTVFAWQDDSPGIFNPSAPLASNPQIWEGILLPMDVDGDGLADLVNAYGVDGDLQLTLLLSDGTALSSTTVTFTPAIPYRAGMQILPMDVSGNGCMDLVCATESDQTLALTVLTSQAGTNGGWTFAGPPNGPQSTSLPWGGRLVAMDVNGDGCVDLVYAYESSGKMTLAVLFSNGSSFEPAPGAVPLVTSVDYFPAAQWLAFDFNGDTMADLLYVYQNGKTLASALFLSSGTGLVEQPTDPFAASPPPNLGTLVALDVNADGLGDIVQAYLENGNLVLQTFCSNGASFAPPITQSGFGLSGLGAGVPDLLPADVNGDGLPDLVVAVQNGQQVSLSVLLGTGAGFSVAVQDVTQPASSVPWGGNVLPMDFNGDGKTDLLFAYESGGDLTLAVMTASGPYPDLVSTITNGLGGVFAITYAPLTDPGVYSENPTPTPTTAQVEPQGLLNNAISGATYPLTAGALGTTPPTPGVVPCTQSVDFPKYVVATYSKSDGQGHTYSYTYFYTAALLDLTGRGWLGFASIQMTDEDFAATTLTEILQSFPLTGAVASITTSRATDGALMQVVTQTYEESENPPNTGPGVYLAMVCSVVTDYYTFAPPSPPPAPDCSESKSFSFDAFGNPITTSITGTACGAPLYLFESYFNQTTGGAWLIGFKTESKSTADSAGTQVLAWKQLSYDGATMNLTSESVWNDQNDPAPAWETMSYQYDSYGNRISLQDPSLALVQLVYEDTYNTFPQQVTSPPNQTGANLTWEYQYYPQFGALLSATDPNGVVTSHQLDGLGRLLADLGPTPTGQTITLRQISWGTDGTGTYQEAQSLVDWSGTLCWQKSYLDGLSRTYATAELGPDGVNSLWIDKTFNSRDLVVTQSLPYYEGGTPLDVQNTYDNYARLIEVQQPQGDGTVVTTLTYQTVDEVVQVQAVGQPDARTTTLDYSRFNSRRLLVSRTDANGGVTTYGYDALARLTSVVDAIGVVTSYGYDSLGRNIGRAVASGAETLSEVSFQYDDANRTLTQQDGRQTQITQVYDGLRRLVSRTVAPFEGDAAVTTYVLDDATQPYGLGWVGSVLMPDEASYDYLYDACGNRTGTTLTLSGETYGAQKSYSPGRLVTGLVYPDGSAQTNTYNAGEQISTVSFTAAGTGVGAQTLATYTQYSAFGAPGQVSYGNGSQGLYTYDATGRLTTQELDAPDGVIASCSYTWNDFNAALTIDDALDATNDQAFVYDPVGRLLAATGAYAPQQYSYDNGGNLTLKGGIAYSSVGYQARQGTKDGATVFSADYDANGNLIAAVGDDTATAYAYDGDNQLVSAGSFQFSYDAKGRRLVTVWGDGTTIFAVMPEYEAVVFADGSRQHSIFVPGRHGVIASVTAVDAGSPPVGGGLPAPGIFYRYANSIDSTTVQTDDQAGVVTRLAYLPYGELSAESGANTVRQKFGAKELNAELGLYYFGARYYDPVLGRFITADDRAGGPPDQRDVWNLYAYCLNDPVNGVDPTGHNSFSDFFNVHWQELVAIAADLALTVAGIVVLMAPQLGGPAATVAGSTLLGAGLGGLLYNGENWGHFTWGAWGTQIGIGAAGGLIAGGLAAGAGAAVDAAATAGRAAFVAGGIGRIAVNVAAGVVGNAGANAVAQVLSDWASHDPLSAGVWQAAIIGGVAGGVGAVASEGFAYGLSQPLTATEGLAAQREMFAFADPAAVQEGTRVFVASTRNNAVLALVGLGFTGVSDYLTQKYAPT